MKHAALAVIAFTVAISAQSPAGGVPTFTADPAWPKPLPNNWVVGQVAAVDVDAQDHVWILHRPASVNPPPAAGAAPPPPPAGVPAPPVIEFDAAGNFLQAWGGPGAGYDWVQNEHGMSVDHKRNVWVTGGGAKDAQVLKFSSAGKPLLQIGKAGELGVSNSDPTTLARPTNAVVDAATNEVYVTESENGGPHRRVIVFDADTGAYKRLWGAYGEKPVDGVAAAYDPNKPVSREFGTSVHCVRIAKDGLVYVCDRSNNRIQVFRRDGTFVKEGFVARQTVGLGSIWDLELSHDQKYVYVGDGTNNKLWILLRESMEVVASFSEAGTAPGQINSVNGLAVDSKGNLYTAEAANGKRVQKFTLTGY